MCVFCTDNDILKSAQKARMFLRLVVLLINLTSHSEWLNTPDDPGSRESWETVKVVDLLGSPL